MRVEGNLDIRGFFGFDDEALPVAAPSCPGRGRWLSRRRRRCRRPGSIAFWDNRAAVHYAVRNYGDFPRLLERILIADEPQYADL